MRKNTRFILAGLLTVTMVVAPVVGIAQDKPKTPPAGNAADKPAPAARSIPPFRGTVAAVDKDAKTVTVGERVFHVSSETKLTKGSQPATIADITVGDVITGNYTKGDDGKLTAKTMKFGPKPDASEKADKKEKAPEKKKTEIAE
jgi:Domain of unknown function (DUF5666)